jgi:hypothetical protein
MKMPVPLVRLRAMALKQSAVEQDAVTIYLDEMLSSRDRLGRSTECDFHQGH